MWANPGGFAVGGKIPGFGILLDQLESGEAIALNAAQGMPPMGVGRDSRIRRAIIDKNAHIGAGSVIRPGTVL